MRNASPAPSASITVGIRVWTGEIPGSDEKERVIGQKGATNRGQVLTLNHSLMLLFNALLSLLIMVAILSVRARR